MYTRLQTARQQWGGSSTAIDNWLEERQQLIVSYCKLAALPPFDKQQDNQLPSHEAILEFCQLLMDYLSAGHFEVYDQIVSQCQENGSNSKSLAEALYPKISASTDLALEFNDKYAEAGSTFSNFDTDLSNLGQALEERFGLEDELIQTLHNKHIKGSVSA
jgi:regulator of sigma D